MSLRGPNQQGAQSISLSELDALELHSREVDSMREDFESFSRELLQGLRFSENPKGDSEFSNVLGHTRRVLDRDPNPNLTLASSYGAQGWAPNGEEVRLLFARTNTTANTSYVPKEGGGDEFREGAAGFIVFHYPQRGNVFSSPDSEVLLTRAAVRSGLEDLSNIELHSIRYGVPWEYPMLLSRPLSFFAEQYGLPDLSVSDIEGFSSFQADKMGYELSTCHGDLRIRVSLNASRPCFEVDYLGHR